MPCFDNHYGSLRYAGFTLALIGALTGCLNGDLQIAATSSSSVRTCQMGGDQFGTFEGRWASVPVPIAFDASTWTTSSVQPILRAADTWNAHTTAVFGVRFIDYGNANQPRSSTDPSAANVCAQSLLSGGTTGRFDRPVVIYQRSTWAYGASSGRADIARTTTCVPIPAVSGVRFQPLMAAVIEINTQDYFAAGKPQPDLQSVVTHELGHLIGLRHSCDDSAVTAGVPRCSGNALYALYQQAILFPVFNYSAAGAGEIKRALNSNDQGRANCLYMQGT